MPAHRFRIGTCELSTWCAWDALFIPIILGETAKVESTCATTGEPVRLTIGPCGVERVVTLDDGDELHAEQVIIATGRKPRTQTSASRPSTSQQRQTGSPSTKRCRATDGVWAIGDLTGAAMFTHVGKYQARIAVADVLGQGRDADYRAVFSDPEIAAVGLTQARDQGHDIQTATIDLAALAIKANVPLALLEDTISPIPYLHRGLPQRHPHTSLQRR